MNFISNNGRIRLVCSPQLAEEDYLVFEKFDSKRLGDLLLSQIQNGLFDKPSPAAGQILAWLLWKGYMTVKFAVPARGGSGVYHEKFGIFTDGYNDHVMFSGSSNETSNAMSRNFEHFDVFVSWQVGNLERIAIKQRNFKLLWEDKTPELKVFTFPEAAKSGLFSRYRPDTVNLAQAMATLQRCESESSNDPALPGEVRLRDYQLAAISSWFENNGKGIFAMATGSGKTYTAIGALLKYMACLNKPVLVVFVCPYLHLADAWGGSLRRCNISTTLCYGGADLWQDSATKLVESLPHFTGQKLLSLVATNTTFVTKRFQLLLQKLTGFGDQIVFVADEVHNLGSEMARYSLPHFIKRRLGLSATWERHLDEKGTQAISDYFGGPVFSYSLAQAINEQQLCPYEYSLIPVNLTEAERKSYLELTCEIARLWYKSESDTKCEESLKMKLLQRARIVANAEDKLTQLAEHIIKNPLQKRSIVYVGDGSYPGEEAGSEFSQRSIDRVLQLLANKTELRVARFTCEESRSTRAEIIKNFEEGFQDVLVAIRCLDEGVDIPCIESAYILASSTNPRQYIQRRGRILRQSPATGKKRAKIYDFIVLPNLKDFAMVDPQIWQVERELLKRELARVKEFAMSAANRHAACSQLEPFLLEFGLLGVV